MPMDAPLMGKKTTKGELLLARGSDVVVVVDACQKKISWHRGWHSATRPDTKSRGNVFGEFALIDQYALTSRQCSLTDNHIVAADNRHHPAKVMSKR